MMPSNDDLENHNFEFAGNILLSPFARYIRRLRIFKKRTDISSAARDSGISVDRLMQLELDKDVPTDCELILLSRYYDVYLDNLLRLRPNGKTN